MDTRHPEADLLPYLRGELSADERHRLERHLAGCALCRESIDSSAAILRAIADDMRESVRTRLERLSRRVAVANRSRR